MSDSAHRQRKRGAAHARLETSSGGVVYRVHDDGPHFLLNSGKLGRPGYCPYAFV